MARQSQSPVAFNRSTRTDEAITMTSGRAAKVIPLTYLPLLRGDSASGSVNIDVELAEMPRPLLNGVIANVQAWFVPKSAHPQFSGMDEFIHSYQGQTIKSLGADDRVPPQFFMTVDGADVATVAASDFFKTLGLHVPAGTVIQTDLIDAFWLVYNFRLAAHSSRLPRREYASENLLNSVSLPPAFWPTGRRSRMVPDYERALIVGTLDLDIVAGQIPVSGFGLFGDLSANGLGATQDMEVRERSRDNAAPETVTYEYAPTVSGVNPAVRMHVNTAGIPQVYAEMAQENIVTSLADLDTARTTQAFAKLRTAYAGNDTTGFDNDDAIVAELMQGFVVPEDQFKRPWLLDSARVPFGMVERHATDAANLTESVSQGRCAARLSLNVPKTESGGTILVTLEVLPERLDERQSDEWLHISDVVGLPNALRDVQRPEPVDMVLSRRVDALHTTPNLLYGYEPMNDVWNRSNTRLGGAFYQDDPTNPWTEQRSAIWQTSIVDPEFTADHWLAPADFPHNVFSDTTADAFEVVCRHSVSISGLTQIGDVLQENNDDYDAISIDDVD